MVKLLMTWDIKPGRETAYLDFVTSEFAPGLSKLGLEPTEAWYTVYGEAPQILTGAATQDIETMREILSSRDWQLLRDRLLEYVTNFQFKIIRASGRFQL
jgi:hypothetical protein